MVDLNKKGLRSRLIEKRMALPAEVVRESSTNVLAMIRMLNEWRQAEEVLLYWPVRGELDVRPLIDELWKKKIRVLMPRCRPDAYGQMDIACASCKEELVEGAFSIMEPDAERCPAEEKCSPDIAIIPAVCFDRQGYRLGYGGGYYDRLLATPEMKPTLKIGLGYTFQLVEKLPVQPWDMAVDIVCTEEELWRP